MYGLEVLGLGFGSDMWWVVVVELHWGLIYGMGKSNKSNKSINNRLN